METILNAIKWSGTPQSWCTLKTTLVTLAASALTFTAAADGPARTPVQANYEVRFLEMMIDHHAMAVEMAALCEGRVIHAELEELCHHMMVMQLAEIEEMQMWLHHWYGITPEPEMPPGHHQQVEKLAAFSGEEFEIAFMMTMIRHHRMAVVKAGQCTERAYHPELIGACEAIESMQLQEIQMMEEWLCQWYGLCRGL